jgi:hypothetical protein
MRDDVTSAATQKKSLAYLRALHHFHEKLRPTFHSSKLLHNSLKALRSLVSCDLHVAITSQHAVLPSISHVSAFMDFHSPLGFLSLLPLTLELLENIHPHCAVTVKLRSTAPLLYLEFLERCLPGPIPVRIILASTERLVKSPIGCAALPYYLLDRCKTFSSWATLMACEVRCKLPSAFQGASPTGETVIELAEALTLEPLKEICRAAPKA